MTDFSSEGPKRFNIPKGKTPTGGDFKLNEPFRMDVRTGQNPEVGRVGLSEPVQVDVSTLAAERFTHGRYLKTADGKSEYILDENGRTILLFEGDGQGHFSSIYSPLSRTDLLREILCLPEEQRARLAEQLGLPEAQPQDIEEFKKIQVQREVDKALLEQVMSLEPGFNFENRTHVDQNLVRGILQKEYAITSADSDNPIIGTFGLGPCIAVVGYDAENSTAAVAHVDGTTNIQSLDAIFRDMGVDAESLERVKVGLIGGDGSSRKQALEMIHYLQNKGIKISFADIMDKPHPSGFVIDSRNGEIIPNITPHNNGTEEDLRMQMAGLQMNAPIRKEFDGRKPKAAM